MELRRVFDSHRDRHSAKWEHYFDVYDRYLDRFIGKEVTLLEIGVQHGGSLQVWKKYLGDRAKIVGIDINPKTMYSEDQIRTFCGSQRDGDFLRGVLKEVGNPDIIIDDGSHNQLDILKSFEILYERLNDKGVYIVEDLHTAYWSEYAGGIKSPANFVSVTSRWIHDVNKTWIDDDSHVTHIPDLKSISFYDSMLVIEKEKPVKKNPYYAGIKKVI